MPNETPGFDFESLFPVEDYLYFLDETLREEGTAAQVDFLFNALQLQPGERVVDLGCGHGRHAIELARRGVRVLGVDLVEGFLDRAREVAARESLPVELVHADLRAFRPEGPVAHHAVCLFDAFGYFDDAGNEAILRNAFGLVAPGGGFVLDLRTREFVVRIPPVSVLERGDDLMVDRHHVDLATGRLVDRRTMVRGGRVRRVEFSVRLYAFTEIRALLERIGFAVEGVWGGFDGAPLSPARSRTIVLARRPML